MREIRADVFQGRFHNLLISKNNTFWVPQISRITFQVVWVTLLELVVVMAMLLSLGPVIRVWFSAWGLWLLLIVFLGMVVPLALYWRPHWLGGMGVPTAAVLALASGLLLR